MKLDHALSIISEDIVAVEERQGFVRLAEYVFAHKKDLKHMTYSLVAQVVGSKRPDEVLRITQYLSGERVKLLEMKFELIIDDAITPLEDEVVYHAETTGSLIHPETGNPVADYEGHVYPYFIPSEEVDNG